MKAAGDTRNGLSAVPLLNAVYCADCETITNSPHDVCRVCGSYSLTSLFQILGGTLRGQRPQPSAKTGKYNLELTAKVREIPASELDHAIELMSRLAEAGGDVECLHINLESILGTEPVLRAA